MTAFKKPGSAIGRASTAASPAGGFTLPAFGAAYAGGYFAGVIMDTGAAYALIVAPSSSDITAAWKTSATPTAGTDSRTNGPANTAASAAASHPAASHCANLTIGAYSDWYLPAIDELLEAARHKDTLPAEAQLAAATYWSSTQTPGGTTAYRVDAVVASSFPTQNTLAKDNANSTVRAFRRVLL